MTAPPPPPVRTRDELIVAQAEGRAAPFLFFWGHTAPADGAVGPHVLSQWWPAAFTVDGVRYATAEHWMMAAKARLFGDPGAEAAAVAAASPADAKQVGRRVRNFDQARWAASRVDIVVQGSVAKFGQHDDLRAYLLGTGEHVLVEASPRDTVWGIGLSAGSKRAADPLRWRGGNLLGFALMVARARLRAGPASA